jgi:hypothetical protein
MYESPAMVLRPDNAAGGNRVAALRGAQAVGDLAARGPECRARPGPTALETSSDRHGIQRAGRAGPAARAGEEGRGQGGGEGVAEGLGHPAVARLAPTTPPDHRPQLRRAPRLLGPAPVHHLTSRPSSALTRASLLLTAAEFSPFYGIEKGSVLQEARIFHDTNIDPRRCQQVQLAAGSTHTPPRR